MASFESISRRSLIKLIAMASPAMWVSALPLAGGTNSERPATIHGTEASLSRPRLFYNDASLGRIRKMLAADPAADAALKKTGEELMAANFFPEAVAEIGGGQQANYITPARQISDMGLTLGLLYHLTGDRRYADKLREAMLHYATYVRWYGQGLADRAPQWHSELDTATFSFGYSAGYDTLRGILSEHDRKTISDAMVRLAVMPILGDWVLPGTRIHSFDSMGHNWWGVCVSGGGLCALALLGDDPRARGWIDAVDAGFAQWFNYRGDVLQNRAPTFERSGPSYESVGYTNYGVSEYLHYRLAWQNTFPDRTAAHMEPLDHLATFYLHTLYPTSGGCYTVDFNDSSLRDNSVMTVLLLIACGLGAPDATRYLKHVHAHPEGTLFSLLRLTPAPAASGEVAESFIYPKMGWTMMRSSWEDDATFLAMKSGYTWNHAHADAGTFILFKKGMPLIIDSGTCSYSRPEYTTYYRQSLAHNVILFHGEGQPKEDINLGCKFPGRMHSLIDGLGLKYAYADATGPMARWFLRNYRHWIWSGDVILIIDDVRAHQPGEMEWLLHYDGSYTAAPDGSVTLTNGAAEAVVKILYPQVAHREDAGLADHDPDKKVPYLVFSPGAPAQERQFITAICLDPDAVPAFAVGEDPNYLSLRMQTKETVEEIYLDLRAINTPGTIVIEAGGWSTDAYLLHLTRPVSGGPSVQRFFLCHGSYLRRGGKSFLESLSKLSACWSQGESVEVYSNDGSASIEIAAEAPPRSVRWNGCAAANSYDKQAGLVSLHRLS